MTLIERLQKANEARTLKIIGTFLAVKFMSHRATERIFSLSLHL